VINLFPKRTDRIHVTAQESEYHVLPDRTRPMDYEIYQVSSVTGYGTGTVAEQTFAPFYRSNDVFSDTAYYHVRRDQRVLSENQKQYGARSSYIGTEIFISLVDTQQAPFSSHLRQLGIETSVH